MSDIIARRRFDAFLVSGWHARRYWEAMVACWRSGTPVLVRGDSQIDPRERPLRRRLRRSLYPLFVRRFAACLSVGTRSEEYFRQHGARRVVRSPHFVDNEFFATRAAAVDRGAARAGWGISPDAMVLLFAGKLMPKKHPIDLVRAVARLGHPGMHVLIAGDGELRSACENAARDTGVRATFAGFLNQSEIPRAYAAADALVLPSDARETWGLVVNEAMASGLPAIVSGAAGCAPDLIVEGRTGYQFPLGDTDALAARVQLLLDPEWRSSLARGARAHIAGFTAAAAAAGILEAMGHSRRKVA